MASNNRVFLISALALYLIYTAEGCHNINNVFVRIKDRTGTWTNQTVSGCLQRQQFNVTHVTEIHVEHQKISRLEKDTVRHLINLDILTFVDCGIETIDPGAFRNLLKLRVVEITHNPKLTLIQGGIVDIFDTVEILRFNNNNINQITDEALSNMTIKEVNFSSNDFSRFDPVWFAYSPYIKQLYFQNNHIQQLPKNAFDTMKQLEDINFDNNRIEKIGEGAFRKLRNLRLLSLKNNRLTSINPNVFPSNLQIDTLVLSGNYFYKIPKDILDRLTLNNIVFEYNPFLCACQRELFDWCNANNVVIKKPDNCNLQNLPFCIGTGTSCENPEDDEEEISIKTAKYIEVLQNLPSLDKKCAELENYKR